MQEGLQLGPHQHKLALYRALRPLGFRDPQLGAPQHTLQQAGLNLADLGISRFPSVGCLGPFQSGLETGKGKSHSKAEGKNFPKQESIIHFVIQ